MNSKRTNTRWLLALACLIIVVLAACKSGAADTPTANVSRAGGQSPAGNISRGGAPPASQAPATPAPSAVVKHVNASGTLDFVAHEGLTFGTSGRVDKIFVKELDRVSRGQSLVKLDTASLEKAVKAAEIAVKAAQLTASSAQADRDQAGFAVKSAEADLRQVQANVKSASIDLDIATDAFRKITYPYSYSTFAFDVPQAAVFISDAQRQLGEAGKGLQAGLTADQYAEAARQLQQALESLTKGRALLDRGQGTDVFASGQLAAKDFWTLRAAQLAMDKAQVAVDTAQNTVVKTSLALDNTKTAYNKAQIALDKANNDVDRAKNDLDRARDDLAKATITAPYDGVIARVNVKEGDLLGSNYSSTIAIDIIEPGRMELDFNVNELDVPMVKLGQKVTITVDALPGQQFQGVVTSIGSLPDAASSVVSYEVKTVFDVSQGSPLKAGMAATADITVQ